MLERGLRSQEGMPWGCQPRRRRDLWPPDVAPGFLFVVSAHSGPRLGLTLADLWICCPFHSQLGAALSGSATVCGGSFGRHTMAFSALRPGLLLLPKVLDRPALCTTVSPPNASGGPLRTTRCLLRSGGPSLHWRSPLLLGHRVVRIIMGSGFSGNLEIKGTPKSGLLTLKSKYPF